MADVFVSYARSSARQAQQVAEGLRGLGYSVWIDDELPAHRTYGRVIEEQITAAKAAVVIWSADAVQSEWVLSEANRAREDRKLVQVATDKTRLPMPFDTIQCADLGDWLGDPDGPGWRKVVASVAELIGGSARAVPAATSPKGAAREPVLAVLAFDNLSGDADLTYFTDGVSEEILDTVARSAGLKVIARSSSFQFRGADKAARHVAGELAATHLLDGSVRRSGPRVRVAAQLVDCANETTLWSKRFDRDLTDVFALQDEIAADVAAALKVALSPAPRPGLIKPETYETYLRAQAVLGEAVVFWVHAEALPYLEQVVAEAPTFAAAWESLAYVRAAALRAGDGGDPNFRARHAAVIEAAETALALDATRGRAHLALAMLEPWAAYAARDAFIERARTANPNDAQVLVWAASNKGAVGRVRASLELAREAEALDPRSPLVRVMSQMALASNGRYAEAIQNFVALMATPHPSYFAGALSYAAVTGDWERFDSFEALAPADEPLLPDGDEHFRRYLHNLRTDDRAGMHRALDDIEAMLTATGSVPLNLFTELESYGMRDEAFDLVDRASFSHMFDANGPMASRVAPSVLFDPGPHGGLFQDPRFLRLAKKIGLIDYWLTTDQWPDCAETVNYDFRAEARALAGG